MDRLMALTPAIEAQEEARLCVTALSEERAVSASSFRDQHSERRRSAEPAIDFRRCRNQTR